MMKKWLLAIILTFAVPTAAMAHSNMETSDPEDGATVTEPIQNVTLKFSAGVESGSKMTLTGPGGEQEFEDIRVDGDTMTGMLAEPLPDWDWTVGWNVVSEDGHPIDGEIHFVAAGGDSADAQAEADQEEVAPEDEEDPMDNEDGDEMVDKAVDEGQADSMQEGENQDENQDEGGNSLLTVGLIVAAIVLLAIIFMAVRRKK